MGSLHVTSFYFLWALPAPPALTLTMRTHLMRDRPKPEMAPYRPAADVVRQKDKKKPIQLKRNATGRHGGGGVVTRTETPVLVVTENAYSGSY